MCDPTAPRAASEYHGPSQLPSLPRNVEKDSPSAEAGMRSMYVPPAADVSHSTASAEARSRLVPVRSSTKDPSASTLITEEANWDEMAPSNLHLVWSLNSTAHSPSSSPSPLCQAPPTAATLGSAPESTTGNPPYSGCRYGCGETMGAHVSVAKSNAMAAAHSRKVRQGSRCCDVA